MELSCREGDASLLDVSASDVSTNDTSSCRVGDDVVVLLLFLFCNFSKVDTSIGLAGDLRPML